jgi:hypothetical protein
MRLFDGGEPGVDLLELRVALSLRQRSVECGALHLTMEIAAVARDWALLGHDGSPGAGRRRLT